MFLIKFTQKSFKLLLEMDVNLLCKGVFANRYEKSKNLEQNIHKPYGKSYLLIIKP